jgi:pimeloyl-ACP methyl ester carboxylesterase
MTLASQDTVLTWTEPAPIPLRGTLVLLPGRGESAQVYERFGRRLAADAYRVHAITAPSDDPDLAAEQITDLFRTADPEKPRIVVGSDAGAAYAASLAATRRLPRASALILAGLPVAPRATVTLDWEGELDARSLCPTHRGRISDAGVRPGELFTDLPAAWFDPDVPGEITVPVLGLHGRDDPISPLDGVRGWYAAVPRAELVSITGAPHDVLNDQTHRTVAATVVLFLERLRTGHDLATKERTFS